MIVDNSILNNLKNKGLNDEEIYKIADNDDCVISLKAKIKRFKELVRYHREQLDSLKLL